MAELVGQIQRDIEKRLRELRPLIEEKEQLEAVLAALNGEYSAPANGTAGRPRARATASPPVVPPMPAASRAVRPAAPTARRS